MTPAPILTNQDKDKSGNQFFLNPEKNRENQWKFTFLLLIPEVWSVKEKVVKLDFIRIKNIMFL